jgi:predicted nucleic acid-binding protein
LKQFFDSSVLVSVFYADHPQHASSAKLFLAAGKDDFCALRTLAGVKQAAGRIRGSEELPTLCKKQNRKRVGHWGFRTMPISVPGMPISGSGMMAIRIPG